MATTVQETNKTSMVSWAALGIAVFALIMAFAALGRVGEFAEEATETGLYQDDRYQDNVNDMYDDDRVVTFDVAEQRMAAYRQNFNAEAADATQLTQAELAEMRRDLQQGYQNAAVETRQAWQAVDQDLEVIEQNLREGTINSLEAIDQAIEVLQRDLATDDR